MPKLPETVAKRGSFLFRDPQEHALILERTAAARNTPDAKPRLFQVWWALKDPKTWLLAFAIASASLDVAAFGAFLPTFIHQFGFSPCKVLRIPSYRQYLTQEIVDTQLYTVIPYAFATVSVPLVSILADRIDKRAIPFLVCMGITVTGFVIVLATTNKTALVAGCCFIATGCYPAIVVCASWVVNSHGGYTKRCTAWAVAQVFTQSYSIVATQIYDNPPRYFKGHSVLLALNLIGAVSAAASYFLMKRENKRRDQVAEEYMSRGQQDPDNVRTFEELCDSHPQWRYKL
jgi:MFS family permease